MPRLALRSHWRCGVRRRPGRARRAAHDCCAASACMWIGANLCRRWRHFSNRAGRAMFAAIHVSADRPGGLPHSLLRLAQEFSPLVEQTAADTVALDAGGLERIHGLPQQIASALARRAVERGLQASVAIAANLDTAVHAARGFAGVSVIPYGDEAKYLGSLPLTLLGPTPEMQE